MPFRYEGFVNPYASSIAELLAHGNDARARAAEQIGAAQARAAEVSGAAWAGAVQNATHAAAAIPGQIEQSRAQGQERQVRQQQLESGALALDAAKREQAGERALSGMMSGDTLRPGDVGPRQENYLDANGLFDVKRITARLGELGFGDKAHALVKGAESINDSILRHQDYEQKTATQRTVLLGDLADGALKMMGAGTPIDKAMDFVVQPALATKRFTAEDYAKIKSQILPLSPDQQQQALVTMMDQAARLGGDKMLGKDAKEVDRYGRAMATNIIDEPNKGDYTINGQRFKADGTPIGAVVPSQTQPPRRTAEEQDLDAFAKSLGKTNAEALTYADRQAFKRNEAAIRASATFQEHVNARTYDNAHPAPDKPKKQDDLEQEYRTVLARGLSSRSGGLGLEDAKVQQANHLTALLDQSYDAKTDTYNIPKVMQTELALGLARLVSPSGTVGVQMEEALNQRTAKGDFNGALTYILGTPFNGSTQDVVKMFKDSITRQGEVAQQNRENEMRYLRGLAPTSLDEERRKSLEANSLGALRQSRVIRNTSTGERKLQVSIDGGSTWK